MRALRWIGIYAVCFCTVLFVRLGLWVTRYQTIRTWVVRPCRPDPQPERLHTVARIAQTVARVARIIPDASCLTQSIATQALLSWKDIPSTISIGVQQADGVVLRAHAWVIWNGRVISENVDEAVDDFSKILDLPTPVAVVPT